MKISAVAAAVAASRAGRAADAAAIVTRLIAECFGLEIAALTINHDQYSLNSLNGLLQTVAGGEFFFKFHHEENEEAGPDELYQANILQQAGYSVDVPSHASQAIGRQILLYPRRRDQRFADLCRDLDAGGDIAEAMTAQRNLDKRTSEIYLETLHQLSAEDAIAAPIHQLFHARLVDPGRPGALGCRATRFFAGEAFRLGGVTVPAMALRTARLVINGIEYRDTIETLLESSRDRLAPQHFAGAGAVVAHGDAHNANLWYEAAPAPRLVMFDPAFAGRHVPALLAEVKATMHNVFAHPLWLYDAPAAAETYQAEVRHADGILRIDTDWRLTGLREAILASKIEHVWRPLLAGLHARDWLPDDWQTILRLALFCCPALVMELRARPSGPHNATSSAIGLAMAVQLGTPPLAGQDNVTRFLAAIAP